ncbi:MAG: site-2 protease family protein [Actinobacteria bacterium]|nr:MAG: site-2 protease family protein [Actinomycetota bacterium]
MEPNPPLEPGPALTPGPGPPPARAVGPAPGEAPDPFGAPYDGTDAFGRQRTPLGKRLAGALAALGALLAKFWASAKAVLLLLPKLKLLTTSGTMLVSIAAYSLIWGWQFAIGLVLLLLVHEMGHVIQLRREGIKASAPMFIPFLGAVISAKSLGGNALAEARVGLAGPILGSVGAALLIPIGAATGNNLFYALAFTGFFLNLFNLLPVVPLDGGRAMAAMAPWMWLVGLGALVVLMIVFPNPIILLIVLFAAMETFRRYKAIRAARGAGAGLDRSSSEPPPPGHAPRGEYSADYYNVRPRDRALVAFVYLGLIAALVVGMQGTHIVRHVS